MKQTYVLASYSKAFIFSHVISKIILGNQVAWAHLSLTFSKKIITPKCDKIREASNGNKKHINKIAKNYSTFPCFTYCLVLIDNCTGDI
uniref:Putative ovule protein n=1 Tax=Solanum chacoense TaxID=4108 RepID=A0A0V0GY42_SOLCH